MRPDIFLFYCGTVIGAGVVCGGAVAFAIIIGVGRLLG